jgi:hypothetical protein
VVLLPDLKGALREAGKMEILVSRSLGFRIYALVVAFKVQLVILARRRSS